jgi:hypothetical protein
MTSPIEVCGGSFVELSEGTREWSLVSIDEKTRKKTIWRKDNSGKNIPEKTNDDEKVLSFHFVTIDEEFGEAHCRVMVPPKSAENSGFVLLLKEMAPGRVTKEMIGDAEGIWKIALSLIGKNYMMSTVGKGGFNNKVTIMPMPKTSAPKAPQTLSQAKKVVQQQAQVAEEPPPFDDDDINF